MHLTGLLVAAWSQVDISAFPKLEAYVARIKALPSVQRAYATVPALPQEALVFSKKGESAA